MKTFRVLAGSVAAAFCLSATSAEAWWPFYRPADPLAQRDKWGLLHQTRDLDDTDFAPRRYLSRFTYNVQSSNTLINDPAYVGALQNALRRRGLYCGPIDGLFSDEVSLAIARLQKNASLRVTGMLNWDVRRELHLP